MFPYGGSVFSPYDLARRLAVSNKLKSPSGKRVWIAINATNGRARSANSTLNRSLWRSSFKDDRTTLDRNTIHPFFSPLRLLIATSVLRLKDNCSCRLWDLLENRTERHSRLWKAPCRFELSWEAENSRLTIKGKSFNTKGLLPLLCWKLFTEILFFSGYYLSAI